MMESKLKVLDAVFRAVQDSFKTMAEIEVSQGRVFNREESPVLEKIKIVASIPLRSPPNFAGKLFLYISESIYLAILSKMVGQELTMESEEALTGAGELLNIISGHVNLVLSKEGYSIKQDELPKVLDEHDRSVLGMMLTNSLVLTFDSSLGNFFVEVQTNG